MGPNVNSILYNLDLEPLFVKCCPEGQFAKFVQNTFNKQAFRNDNFQKKVFGNNNLHTKKASWMTICQIWKKTIKRINNLKNVVWNNLQTLQQDMTHS